MTDSDSAVQQHEERLEELARQKELIDKQKELLVARRALDALKRLPAEDGAEKTKAAAEAAKAVAEQRKAQAEADKAAAEAEVAAAKAKFPGLELEGQEGTVTTEGDNVGAIEARLLATAAIKTAASRIAAALENVSAAKILLFSPESMPSLATLTVYRARLKLVEGALDDAMQMEPPTPVPEAAAEVAMAGTALESLSALLSFFRSDYTVGSVEVSIEDSELILATAHAINATGREVRIPSLFNPEIAAADSLKESDFVESLRRLAIRKRNAERIAADLDEQIDEAGDDAAEPAIEKRDALRAAIAVYEDLMSSLITVEAEEAKAPLYDLLVEQQLHGFGQAGYHFLVLKVNGVGGGYLIKKNLLTGLGAMPLYHMGGATISYVLMRGDTGAVEAANAIAIHGGFVKAGEMAATLERPQG